MKRILIVEDDPIIAQVYASEYRSAGFEVSTAEDGQEGLDRLKTFKPDLVHLDLTIPKVNGAEVVRRIRARLETESLPVIVLSNTYQNRLVKGAIAAGASECISKAGSTPKMMLGIVEKHLDRSRPGASNRDSGPPAAAVEPPTSAAAQAAAEPEITPIGGHTTRIQKHAVVQTEIARGFLARAPQKLFAIRERVAPLFQADMASRAADLAELWQVTESFAGQAAIAGFERLSQVASALAALLQELVEAPAAVSASSVHTIVQASDFLAQLVERTPGFSNESSPPALALVVDDDPVARRAVCSALARLDVPAISLDQAKGALSLVADNPFSLIFADINMPGMDGFEFCRALRALPGHAGVPVVFVSGRADEDTRRRALDSGGSDLIEKPFLPMELAVKALTLLP